MPDSCSIAELSCAAIPGNGSIADHSRARIPCSCSTTGHSCVATSHNCPVTRHRHAILPHNCAATEQRWPVIGLVCVAEIAVYGDSGLCISGPSAPSPYDASITAKPATAGEYHWSLNSRNGVSGRAKAHAPKAIVAADISQMGQLVGLRGIGRPADLILVAKAIHAIRGVPTRKIQNGNQRPISRPCESCIGPNAASAAT
jgi:hypothetical protein